MKSVSPAFNRLAEKLVLSGLMGVSSISLMHAAPPPSAFGVRDRHSKFDQREYPFLKGLTCNPRWSDVEKKPGEFDWSELDEALQKAEAQNEFV